MTGSKSSPAIAVSPTVTLIVVSIVQFVISFMVSSTCPRMGMPEAQGAQNTLTDRQTSNIELYFGGRG